MVTVLMNVQHPQEPALNKGILFLLTLIYFWDVFNRFSLYFYSEMSSSAACNFANLKLTKSLK